MKDTNLIADLVRAGLDADLVGRVVNEITSSDTPRSLLGYSAEEDVLSRRRKADRERKKAAYLLKKQGGGKQTMSAAEPPHILPGLSAENPLPPCEVKKDSTEVEGKEEKRSKEVVVAGRKRGSRLPDDWSLSESDRQFAQDWGVSGQEIDRRLAEFIDFWRAVPGQRGTKLDWSATWRNRVRTVGKPQAPIASATDEPPKGWRPGLPTHEELKRKYAKNEPPEEGGGVLESRAGTLSDPQIGRVDQPRNGRMVKLGSLFQSPGVQAGGDDAGGTGPDETQRFNRPGSMA